MCTDPGLPFLSPSAPCARGTDSKAHRGAWAGSGGAGGPVGVSPPQCGLARARACDGLCLGYWSALHGAWFSCWSCYCF